MQFVKPEVSGLAPAMAKLREKIQSAGPYVLAKTAHHTSYNGLDGSILAELGGSAVLVHSGGFNDGGHPDGEALQTLQNADTLSGFARTDRNGLISCDLSSPELQITLESGDLDDFSPNEEDPIPAPVAEPPPVGPVEEPVPPPVIEHPPAPVVNRQRSSDGMVEVITRLPHVATKVTLTIQIEPAPEVPPAKIYPETSIQETDVRWSLAGGRALPALLFVTSAAALGRKIGLTPAAAIIANLLRRGARVLDSIPDTPTIPETALAIVKRELQARSYAGVVIIGDYDVVPSLRLDALDPVLRAQLPPHAGDSDNFIVWSDAEYGDQDGDGMPEIPVSRVPDGGSAEFLITVLSGRSSTDAISAFGIRNRERPFADGIYQVFRTPHPLLRSDPSGRGDIPEGALSAANLYLMLHGSDRDATRFWGEDEEGAFEAINVGNIPPRLQGTVLTGCCWGALIVEHPALHQQPTAPPRPRVPRESLALSFLAAGAKAFVGCTGSHYSPTVAPYGYFGGPMHSAFWSELLAGRPPAQALFNAKASYLQRFPHGRSHAIEVAIELKIYHQFTCLGLGW